MYTTYLAAILSTTSISRSSIIFVTGGKRPANEYAFVLYTEEET
jgi:hypothetical protein